MAPLLRIRSITYFATLQPGNHEQWQSVVTSCSEFLKTATDKYTELGYEVQTTRLATNPLSEYMDLSSKASVVADAQKLEDMCTTAGIPIVSIGPLSDPAHVTYASEIVLNTKILFCTYAVPRLASHELTTELGEQVLTIARATEGAGNFKFATTHNMGPGCPFFPAAYADTSQNTSRHSFALATENTTILHDACLAAKRSLDELTRELRERMTTALAPLCEVAAQVGPGGPRFGGVDASLAPGLDTPTMTSAYEALGLGDFGEPGTLAISAAITAALKSIDLPLCGYSGLMLPVCEDQGLAKRATEGKYKISDIVQYSSVCGCGLDTVPVAGCTSARQLGALALDVGALAFKLNKPLSIRLLPVPGLRVGQMTNFDNPHLCNSGVLPF